MAKALTWCVDWKHLKPMEQMMMWFPVIGTQRRIYADLIRQLKTRDSGNLTAWESCPQQIRELAAQVSRILIECLRWPKNTIFLPDDPADIVFWDRTGDLAGACAIMAVEKAVGREMDVVFWGTLPAMTFLEVVQKLKDPASGRGSTLCEEKS